MSIINNGKVPFYLTRVYAMFQLHANDATKLCDGLSRREMMRVGGLGLGGLSLASLIKNRETRAKQGSGNHGAGFGKAKNVIIFGDGLFGKLPGFLLAPLLGGGRSQFEGPGRRVRGGGPARWCALRRLVSSGP